MKEFITEAKRTFSGEELLLPRFPFEHILPSFHRTPSGPREAGNYRLRTTLSSFPRGRSADACRWSPRCPLRPPGAAPAAPRWPSSRERTRPAAMDFPLLPSWQKYHSKYNSSNQMFPSWQV